MSAGQEQPAQSSEPVTGFRPADESSEPATTVSDAIEEFTAALGRKGGTEVRDPRHGLTEEERLKQHSELMGFVLCQREGEELSGVVPRK